MDLIVALHAPQGSRLHLWILFWGRYSQSQVADGYWLLVAAGGVSSKITPDVGLLRMSTHTQTTCCISCQGALE